MTQPLVSQSSIIKQYCSNTSCSLKLDIYGLFYYYCLLVSEGIRHFETDIDFGKLV